MFSRPEEKVSESSRCWLDPGEGLGQAVFSVLMIWGGGLPGKVRLVILWVSTSSLDSYPGHSPFEWSLSSVSQATRFPLRSGS